MKTKPYSERIRFELLCEPVGKGLTVADLAIRMRKDRRPIAKALATMPDTYVIGKEERSSGSTGRCALIWAVRRLHTDLPMERPADTVTLNQARNAAVDQAIEWRPLDTCPRGVTVWLLTRYNKGIEGRYNPDDKGVKGWYPFPNIPEDMKRA